jgi:hypothetical protein
MALNSPAPLPSTSIFTQPSAIDGKSVQSIADTVDVNVDFERLQKPMSVKEGDALLLEAEDGLSEQQLRELHDREEIDRFLNLFAAVRICCCYRVTG